MQAARNTRKGLIAKIHVAKKQLALTDENYRDVLRRITGIESSADMSERQLESVVREFARLGFSGKHRPKASGKKRMADEPQARKIRALWLQLKNLDQLSDSSEEALASYVKRMCGIDDLHWITPADANKVIKGLRGWISRVGGNPNDF